MDKPNKINLKFKDKEYILEYSRYSIQTMEKEGFNIQEVSNKPAVMLPLLFEGAFTKNHKFVKRQEIDEIYNSISKKDELIGVLSQMVLEAYECLLGDNKEVDEGNAHWEIVK